MDAGEAPTARRETLSEPQGPAAKAGLKVQSSNFVSLALDVGSNSDVDNLRQQLTDELERMFLNAPHCESGISLLDASGTHLPTHSGQDGRRSRAEASSMHLPAHSEATISVPKLQ